MDGLEVCCHVDLGFGVQPDDSSPPAANALVLMAVSLNSSWKLPVGYFLVQTLSADEKVSIIKTGLKKTSRSWC